MFDTNNNKSIFRMTTAEIIKEFGEPGDYSNFVTIVSPFPLKLDWDKTKTTVRITVHKKAATSLSAILQELLDVYGLDKINELGINEYAGCFNNRPKRGTEERYKALMNAGQEARAKGYLSLHSWALAIDLDADRNKLHETKKTARFARSEYIDMIAIFYKHGWYSLGIEKDYDWMHMQYIKP